MSISNGFEFSGSLGGNAILYLASNSGVLSNTQNNISSNMGYSNGSTTNYYSGVEQFPFPLWLTSIQTGSTVQFAKQATQTRYSYVPIRRSEMTVQFTAVWPYRLLNEMNNFSEAIRQHYFYALANTAPMPMTLIYLSTRANAKNSGEISSSLNNNPMAFTGWVKAANSGFQRFQSLFSRSFSMEVLTQPAPGNTTLPSSVYNNTSFIPSAADAENYTTGWYQVAPSQGPSLYQISGIG